MSSAVTFNEKTFSGLTAVQITAKNIEDSVKRIEWINYAVDPEWARFCSVGPEDIGSVWEKIGAIRKRPGFETVVMSNKMIQKMNDLLEQRIIYGEVAESSPMFGVRFIGCPMLDDGIAYKIRADLV